MQEVRKEGAVEMTLSRAPMVLSVLVIFFAAVSCNGDRIVSVTFDEFLQQVSCDEDGECTDMSGNPVEGHRVDVNASASASLSSFSPRGTYLYIDHMRSDTFVEVEMDFPTDEGADTGIRAMMREYRAGELVFESDVAAGRIRIVPPGEPDRIPGYGSFHLRFADAGEDGEPGTPDDEIREIRNATFQIEGHLGTDSPRCVDVSEDGWEDPWYGTGIVEVTYYPYDPWDSSYYQEEGYADTSSGCQGDTYDDGWDDDYGETSGGCSGDTYDDPAYYDGSSSGCEGDTYDDSDPEWDCEDDEYALSAPRPPRRLLAFLMPGIALFFTRSILRRKR